VALLGLALLAAACGGGRAAQGSSGPSDGSASDGSTVSIALTPEGCVPEPATVPTGQVQFNVKNQNAGAVSEAELRTQDLSHILGEQENLTPGLSGGFALTVQPGNYIFNCPGGS
jgi:iron uptake system component EfeO